MMLVLALKMDEPLCCSDRLAGSNALNGCSEFHWGMAMLTKVSGLQVFRAYLRGFSLLFRIVMSIFFAACSTGVTRAPLLSQLVPSLTSCAKSEEDKQM